MNNLYPIFFNENTLEIASNRAKETVQINKKEMEK